MRPVVAVVVASFASVVVIASPVIVASWLLSAFAFVALFVLGIVALLVVALIVAAVASVVAALVASRLVKACKVILFSQVDGAFGSADA